VELLASIFTKPHDPAIRKLVAAQVGNMGTSQRMLDLQVQLLSDPDPQVRSAVVQPMPAQQQMLTAGTSRSDGLSGGMAVRS